MGIKHIGDAWQSTAGFVRQALDLRRRMGRLGLGYQNDGSISCRRAVLCGPLRIYAILQTNGKNDALDPPIHNTQELIIFNLANRLCFAEN